MLLDNNIMYGDISSIIIDVRSLLYAGFNGNVILRDMDQDIWVMRVSPSDSNYYLYPKMGNKPVKKRKKLQSIVYEG